jgi:hypothetical protein
LFVKHKATNDPTTEVIPINPWEKRLRRHIERFKKAIFKTEDPVMQSYALFQSTLPKLLNNSDFDLVHLHWINNEMLSIKDIGHLKKPLSGWKSHGFPCNGLVECTRPD